MKLVEGIGRADMIENLLEEFVKLPGESSCSQQHVFDTWERNNPG